MQSETGLLKSVKLCLFTPAEKEQYLPSKKGLLEDMGLQKRAPLILQAHVWKWLEYMQSFFLHTK